MTVRIRTLFRRPARQSTSERDVETWLDELKADPGAHRDAKAAIDRAIRIYTGVLAQQHDAVCSCTGGHIVVIHDPGSYCGDQQAGQVADAIAVADGRYLGLPPLADLTYEQMAAVALNTLGGTRD